MTTQVEILQFLHYNPSSSRVEIAAALSDTPNERTLKRMIAGAVQRGDIVVEGKGTACACVVILYSTFCRRQQTNGTNHGQCDIGQARPNRQEQCRLPTAIAA